MIITEILLDLLLVCGIIWAVYMVRAKKYRNDSERKLYIWGAVISALVILFDLLYYFVM